MTMEQTASPAPAVNVQEIMERIRQRIDEKKKTGEYTPEELERIDRYVLQIEAEGYNTPEEDLRNHLSLVNYLFDTLQPPELSSHRKRLGGLITGLKRAILRISEPYRQMLSEAAGGFQRRNGAAAEPTGGGLSFSGQHPGTAAPKNDGGAAGPAGSHGGLKPPARRLGPGNSSPKNRRGGSSGRVAHRERGRGAGPAVPEAGAERLRAFEYLLFENRHRGSEAEIKARQRAYLPYFRESGSVLDIGCGRGEFLELLKEAGIPAQGAELNPEMVQVAQQKGVEVIQGDGLEYLRKLPDRKLGGIFLSQVIEHLGPENLRELVRTAFLKLAPGGVLLAETVNPQCLTTFSGAFYVDLSHHNPIHPEAARYLWESVGFRQVNILYVSPYPPEMLLKEMVRRDDESYEDEIVRVLNENVRRLNDLLYGYQDYAVVGTK